MPWDAAKTIGYKSVSSTLSKVLEGERALPSVSHHLTSWLELVPPDKLGPSRTPLAAYSRSASVGRFFRLPCKCAGINSRGARRKDRVPGHQDLLAYDCALSTRAFR